MGDTLLLGQKYWNFLRDHGRRVGNMARLENSIGAVKARHVINLYKEFKAKPTLGSAGQLEGAIDEYAAYFRLEVK